EAAPSVAERHPHAFVAEADDVRDADASQIGEEARMPVDAPAPGDVAEILEHGHGREPEAAVAVAERHVDAGIAEPDDVRAAVAVDVGEEAGMPVDAPSLLIAEIREHEGGRVEGAAARGARDPDPGLAEADDVGAAVA